MTRTLLWILAGAALLAPLASADLGTDVAPGPKVPGGSFVCGADAPATGSGSGPYWDDDPLTVGVWSPLFGGNFIGITIYPDGSGSCPILHGGLIHGTVALDLSHLPDIL